MMKLEPLYYLYVCLVDVKIFKGGVNLVCGFISRRDLSTASSWRIILIIERLTTVSSCLLSDYGGLSSRQL